MSEESCRVDFESEAQLDIDDEMILSILDCGNDRAFARKKIAYEEPIRVHGDESSDDEQHIEENFEENMLEDNNDDVENSYQCLQDLDGDEFGEFITGEEKNIVRDDISIEENALMNFADFDSVRFPDSRVDTDTYVSIPPLSQGLSLLSNTIATNIHSHFGFFADKIDKIKTLMSRMTFKAPLSSGTGDMMPFQIEKACKVHFPKEYLLDHIEKTRKRVGDEFYAAI